MTNEYFISDTVNSAQQSVRFEPKWWWPIIGPLKMNWTVALSLVVVAIRFHLCAQFTKCVAHNVENHRIVHCCKSTRLPCAFFLCLSAVPTSSAHAVFGAKFYLLIECHGLMTKSLSWHLLVKEELIDWLPLDQVQWFFWLNWVLLVAFYAPTRFPVVEVFGRIVSW